MSYASLEPSCIFALNNSGSDKRELYTIAQALQKPYHDLLFAVHRLIIRFNKWTAVKPDSPFIQLTTLDESIRLAKGNVFAEWKKSETAKLFEDHGYKIKSKQEATSSKKNCYLSSIKQNEYLRKR